MLQKMRQFSKSKLSAVMLGLLALAFVSWGIGDIFQGGIDNTVVKVGSTKVDKTEFARDYKNLLERLGTQRGTPVTAQEAKSQGIDKYQLQLTIINTAIDNVARDLGLTASDKTVVARIQSMQMFSPLGTFDKRTFLEAINHLGYTEKEFIEAMRKDLARDQLTHASESGFSLPPGYARAILAYLTEMRAVEYTVIDPASMPPVAPPPDATLAAYVKAHADSYSTPEYRDVTYGIVTPADVIGQVVVTDKLLRQQYENNKSQYVVEDKREIQQLTFTEKKDADAAVAKLKGGAKFADVAKAAGYGADDIEKTEVAAGDLGKDVSKVVFALPEGGVTDPAKSEFGWNIVHVVKLLPGHTTPFEAVKESLRPVVAEQLARARIDTISNAYIAAYSDGLTLVEAAKKAGLKVVHIAAMDHNGLAPDGSRTAAPEDEEFRDGVFKAEIGDEGDPLLTKTGAFYVILVNGQTPPKLKPLAEVRTAALEAWTAEQHRKQIKQRAQDIATKATKAKALSEVAKAFGYKVENSKALQRQMQDDPVMSQDVLTAVFDAMPGTAVIGPQAKGDGYVVARITGIAHRLPAENAEMYTQIVKALSDQTAPDVTTSLAYAAREEQGVTVNNKQLEDAIGGNEGQ